MFCYYLEYIRVGPPWEWIGLKVEGEVEGYSYFCLKCSFYNSPARFWVQGKNLFRSRVIKLCITWVNRPMGIQVLTFLTNVNLAYFS